MRERILLLSLVCILGGWFAAVAQPAGAEVPDGEPGESIFVPLSNSSGIVIDGDLVDWSGVPFVVTTEGPTAADTGEVKWQVAADGQELYFAATIADSSIVAGEHGDNYWNEDSIEFYVNFSADQNATTYGPGIAQITVSPVDIDNDDPDNLTISGNNAASMDVSGFVFPTADGWGVVVALNLSGLTAPAHREGFGVQIQVNSSSGGDRDNKLSWSTADVNDTSFQDPSVFGTAIFFDELIESVPAQTDDQSELEPEIVPDTDVPPAADDETDEALTSVSEDTAPKKEVVTGGDETAEVADAATTGAEPETSGNRSLLIAAIISVASIMVGGLWFERRRKLSESRLAAGAGPDLPQDDL
jgi:hypothetical protein